MCLYSQQAICVLGAHTSTEFYIKAPTKGDVNHVGYT